MLDNTFTDFDNMSINSKGEGEAKADIGLANLGECSVPEQQTNVRQQLKFDSIKTPSDHKKPLSEDYQTLIGSSGSKSLASKFESAALSSEKKPGQGSPDETFLIGCEDIHLVHTPLQEAEPVRTFNLKD